MDYYGDLKTCSSGRYNHKLELFKKVKPEKALCKKLSKIYPFVKRRLKKLSNGVKVEESLIKNNNIIHSILVDEEEFSHVI